jgi:CheY-like chemotaxis protein
MARVRVIHWKPAEAGPLVEASRACGHEVEFDEADFPQVARKIRQNPPDALVIDLTLRPSYGRELAISMRQRKDTRRIPIVFVDGAPEKVEAIRQQLPDAFYGSRKQLCARIRVALRSRPEDPVVPPAHMERYRSRSAAQKLGIVAGATVALFDAPRDYAAVIGELPAGVEMMEDPDAVHPVTLWFVHDPRDYQAELRRMKAIASRTKLWVVWRKGSTNGLTQFFVRESANAVGLVDYKICAIDEHWSGMAFAVKKASGGRE